MFFLYIFLLNFEPLSVTLYKTGGNDFNNLELTIAKDVFKVISQLHCIVVLKKKLFKHFSIHTVC